MSLLQFLPSPPTFPPTPPTLKLNQFHFHTCVWWDNYSQLNRAQSLKTHLYTLFVFFFLSSHSATVCEIKSIPPATLLPSKSVLIITAASTCTHTKMDKQRISALTGSHICPHLYSINLSSSFQCWMLLCQPFYLNTHARMHAHKCLLSGEGLSFEHVSGRQEIADVSEITFFLSVPREVHYVSISFHSSLCSPPLSFLNSEDRKDNNSPYSQFGVWVWHFGHEVNVLFRKEPLWLSVSYLSKFLQCHIIPWYC